MRRDLISLSQNDKKIVFIAFSPPAPVGEMRAQVYSAVPASMRARQTTSRLVRA